MHIQAMNRMGRQVRYHVPIVCAGCVAARHFWKVSTGKGNDTDAQRQEPKKDVQAVNPRDTVTNKVGKESSIVSSIISGDLWKSYAEKTTENPTVPSAEMPEANVKPFPPKERGVVSSILSGKLWKPSDDTKKGVSKPCKEEDLKSLEARDKWFDDFDFFISKIPNQILNNRMKESLQDLAKLGDNVYRKVDKRPDHPMFLNIALLRLYAIQTHEDSAFISGSEDRGELADLSDQFAAEIIHYFKYADEVYEADPTVLRQDIVLNQLEENEALHIPRHIVFVDHITRSIVVAIRGTASLNDMITDLYIEAAPFLDPSRDLYAHKGIAESAQAMLPSITATINKVRSQDRGKYEKYRVVTTGHSLGAGSAALLAILLSTESKIAVECFAFAPPPIISKPNAHESRFPFEFMNANAPCTIHSFVHDRDFITRCSHKELLNMLSALTAIDALKWTDYERSSAVFRGKLTDAEKQEIRDVLTHDKRKIVDGNDVALYVPGDIMLIRPVVSAEITTAEQLPDEQPSSSTAEASPANSYSLNGAWQRVKQTVSEHGSGVISSSVSETKPPTSNTSQVDAAQAQGKNNEEKESERQKEKLRLDRLQYEVIAVPSADSLFNGLLYYGDSMVNDHLITSYRRALLRMIKS